MRFPGRLGKIAAAVFVLTAAVFSLASEPDVAAFLPEYPALAAGADLNALGSHPQSAEFFAELEKICGRSAGELSKVLLACDSYGARRMVLAGFDAPESVSRLCRKAGKKRLAAEDHRDFKVFLLKGKQSDRRAVRLVQFSDDIIGVFTAFPKGEKFRVDPGKSLITDQIPRRKNVLIWGYGLPRINQGHLQHIRMFYFTLEPDINGKLLLHGKVIFAGALQSSAVYWFVKQAVPLILSAKYDVSFWDSYRAVSALDVKRNEEELIFSTRNVGPVFKVFAAVFRDRLSLLREIAQ